MSNITHSVVAYVQAKLGSTLAINPCECRHISGCQAKVLRGQYRDSIEAIRLMSHVLFCVLRWDMFSRAAFTFKKLPLIIEDDEPLRFIIPFYFCEPFGRWYRLAPFVVDIEKCAHPQCLVNVFCEAQEIRDVSDTNKLTEKTRTLAQVVFDRTTMVGGRFNVRWSPWRNRP